MVSCSVQDAVQFIDSIQIPIYISIDGSIFLTCTTCIVYQYFKELVASVSKAGAKVSGLFLTAKLFSKFFSVFLFNLFLRLSVRKGKKY